MTTSAQCECRKPKPGLLLEAARDWNIDLARSYFVGDRWRDIEAGQRAGCRPLFIDYNYNERRPGAVYRRAVPARSGWNIAVADVGRSWQSGPLAVGRLSTARENFCRRRR